MYLHYCNPNNHVTFFLKFFHFFYAHKLHKPHSSFKKQQELPLYEETQAQHAKSVCLFLNEHLICFNCNQLPNSS